MAFDSSSFPLERATPRAEGDSIAPQQDEVVDLATLYNIHVKSQEEIHPANDEKVNGLQTTGFMERTTMNARETVQNGIDTISEGLRQRFESVKEFISENKLYTWEGLSDQGKKIATSAYETVYKIPGLNRLVAKREIAWNQMWIDKREVKLNELEAKSATLREQINDKQTNIDSAAQLRELFSATDPKAAERFAEQISNQERSIAVIDAKLKRNADLIKKQRDGVERLEAKRNAVAERMIATYDERIDAIMYQEALIENQLFDSKEKIRASEDSLAKIEETLAQKEALLVQSEAIVSQQSGEAKEDSMRIVLAIKHEIGRTKEMIEHTRLKAQIETRAFNNDIKQQEVRRNPYEQRQNDFIDVINRTNSFTPTQTDNQPEQETAPEVFEGSISESPFEATPSVENQEVKMTIKQSLDTWNTFISKSVNAERAVLNEAEQKLFSIDAKEFFQDIQRKGTSLPSTPLPINEAVKHLAGRVNRQLMSAGNAKMTTPVREQLIARVTEQFLHKVMSKAN